MKTNATPLLFVCFIKQITPPLSIVDYLGICLCNFAWVFSSLVDTYLQQREEKKMAINTKLWDEWYGFSPLGVARKIVNFVWLCGVDDKSGRDTREYELRKVGKCKTLVVGKEEMKNKHFYYEAYEWVVFLFLSYKPNQTGWNDSISPFIVVYYGHRNQ